MQLALHESSNHGKGTIGRPFLGELVQQRILPRGTSMVAPVVVAPVAILFTGTRCSRALEFKCTSPAPLYSSFTVHVCDYYFPTLFVSFSAALCVSFPSRLSSLAQLSITSMASLTSSLQTVNILSTQSIVQQEVVQVRRSFVAGSPAGLVALWSSVKGAPSIQAKRVNAITAAQASQQQTETAENASVQVIETVSHEASSPFATLSASVSTQPLAASSPALPSPPVLGAGLVAAAGIVFVAKKLISKPSQAPVLKLAPQTPATLAYPPRSVKQAAPVALKTMATYFPNAMVDQQFVRACAQELFSLGFSRDNCIALVNTCRDEVCRPLATFIDNEFGLSFNTAGLGGLINCGKTGFKAAMSHSPEFPCDVDGKPRERYVFFAFPHVSVGETGEVGSLLRRGRGKPSSACGALIAIQGDAKAGRLVSEDPDDAEYCLLKKKILGSHTCQNCAPSGPDLVTVTKGALEVITEDLEKLISQTVNPATADYAVITGVQIHSGNQVPGEAFRLDRTIDYIAPGAMYAVIRGKRFEMQVTSGSKVAQLISV